MLLPQICLGSSVRAGCRWTCAVLFHVKAIRQEGEPSSTRAAMGWFSWTPRITEIFGAKGLDTPSFGGPCSFFFLGGARRLNVLLPLWGGGETSLNDPSGRSVLPSASKVRMHNSREIGIPRRLSRLKKGVITKLNLLGVQTACTCFFEAIYDCMCNA